MKKLLAAPYVTGLITNRFEEAMDMRALVEQGSGATV
jgi:glycerophosphoryl diester phosphodiesterase